MKQIKRPIESDYMKTTFYMYTVKDIDTVRMYSDNLAAGSILITPNTNQVYVLNEAQEIIEVVDAKDNNESHVVYEQHPTNCINCGATLTSYKCEYCGTYYQRRKGNE